MWRDINYQKQGIWNNSIKRVFILKILQIINIWLYQVRETNNKYRWFSMEDWLLERKSQKEVIGLFSGFWNPFCPFSIRNLIPFQLKVINFNPWFKHFFWIFLSLQTFYWSRVYSKKQKHEWSSITEIMYSVCTKIP